MGKQRNEPSPEDLDPLRERIRVWRSTRHRPKAMPPHIWNHAVVLAREFGVCKVARAVGLDYTALRKKVAKAMELPGLVLPTFMDLGRLVAEEAPPLISPGNQAAGQSAAGALIDISTPDGTRIRIYLEAGRGMEAAGIMAAFLGGRP